MNINKVIENTYNGDAYLMEILSDNIIINDDYEGLIILDYNLDIVKKISIDQELCIYNAIVIDDKNIILNCIEDKKIYIIIIIETDEVKTMEMPDCIYNEVPEKKIANNENGIIIRTYKNNYFCLDTNQLIVRPYDYVLEEDFDKKELSEEWIDYIKLEEVEIYLSEEKIKIVGLEEQYIYPDEDYYFCRLKVLDRENQKNLIVLSSDGYNENYRITIYKIDF